MKSILLKASAGSGKTTRLTEEVFARILIGGKFISALTFTRAATTEMRSRIMKEIAKKSETNLLERMRLIMEAGRVGYSTIDSFFYRLFAAAGFAPKLADEKEQMELLQRIEARFRDNVMQCGMADKIIIVSRILRTDVDAFWGSLAEEQNAERCLKNMERLTELDALMKENGILCNELESLSKKADEMSESMPAAVDKLVIRALTDYEAFISRAVASYSDLKDYASLGKKIAWEKSPYFDLNMLFRDFRKKAERLAVNKALLRELAVASLCELYFESADAVKREEGLIFFQDVRRGLLALDGESAGERPKLMSNYFSLGLDRTEHLLIDEFQDTSRGDIEILIPLIEEILSGCGERGKRSLFVVGDWKQMIYGWRGADREALENTIGGYVKRGVIEEESLKYNYRSTPLLISFFNQLVANLFDSEEKYETQKPPEETENLYGVTEVNLVSLEKEGNSQDVFYSTIVEYLRKKKAEYECSWGDMAVLALTNNHVQKIEAGLLKEGVRAATVKGRQLLSTEEGLAVMLYIAGVLSGDGAAQFSALAAKSDLWSDLLSNIDDVRKEFAQKYPRPYGIMAVSSAIEFLRGKLPAKILDIWQDETQAFFGMGGADVDGFLARMFRNRFSVKVPESEQSENIKVDTIHGTKGLQFEHVFVFWNEEEKEPAFYLESERCHMQLSGREVEFLKAGESPVIRDIIESREERLAKLRREKANVFYVAATRAVKTLTVFLPVKKDENYKSVHQAILKTFSQFAPNGGKKEVYEKSGGKKENEPLKTYSTPLRQDNEPDKYGEIDPALLSAYIKSGIMRGERLHRWLAKVIDKNEIPPEGELNGEEYAAAIGFIKRSDVSSLMFRPGKIYIEQRISDRINSGIVDRMIVDNDIVTIIDYKSGSMRGLRQKYEEQLKRYTGIMKKLYPSKKIEYYLLPIDT